MIYAGDELHGDDVTSGVILDHCPDDCQCSACEFEQDDLEEE